MQNADKIDVRDRARNRKLIGSYLIEANLITKNNLLRALKQQKVSQERIGNILVKQGSIEQKTLDYFIAKIIKPEQSRNRSLNGAYSSLGGIRANNSIKTFDLANKTLNLNEIALSPAKVFSLLFVVVLLLVLTSLLINFSRSYIEPSASMDYVARLFNLDGEANLPTLYSGLTLVFCSLLLFVISNIKKQARSSFVKHWQALSLIFLYIAIDEVIKIHEKFNFIGEFINAEGLLEGLLYFPWVIIGIVFVIVFWLVFFRFIQSLPKTTKNLFILAGTLYVGGAIGVEVIGAYYAKAYGRESIIYSLVSTLEEFLEMFGILIFIYALLAYIGRYLEMLNLQVDLVANRKLKKLDKN